MPVTYTCETCHKAAQDATSWLTVLVIFNYTPAVEPPAAPVGRIQQGPAVELMFDTLECRAKWCKQADVADPGAP